MLSLPLNDLRIHSQHRNTLSERPVYGPGPSSLPIMTDYDKLKVTDLKDLVKERGIAATGLKLKQQFVDALNADDSSNNGAEVIEGAEESNGNGNGNGDAKDEDAGEDVQEEDNSNKRKRRSPTPPVSEESVSKKLKTADDAPSVQLPEDVAADAPAAVDEAAAKTIQPYGSSDDIMQVDNAEGEDEVMDDISARSAKHPATRALYIRELVRPLQPNSLREHLRTVASPPGATSASAAEIVETFHLDKLRTHALVVFDSTSAASRARNALHDHIWPDEPSMRKPLWVDFVPEDKVSEWIEMETERPDTKWEVTYDGVDTNGQTTAILQEVGSDHQTPAPAAPNPQRSSQSQDPPAPQKEPPPQSKSFDTLDSRYKFTQCKPKIYYQPVAPELADSRQENISTETSREWEDKLSDPSLYGEGELRRYTFEDGDKLVDGGADFGLFGRKSTRGGRGGGEYRGGGRGRGRGEYRGGDYYRGGGSGGRRPY